MRSFGLGLYHSTFDPLDWNLRQLMWRRDTAITQRLWGFNKPALDQGVHPWCGGFSMAHYGICLPTESDYEFADGKNFYDRCKDFDLQPGMQNGTSVRTIANVGRNLGMWSNYAFATDVKTIYDWILNSGPIILGTNWYNNMFVPDADHIIHCIGDLAGGHAWVGIGVDLNLGFIDGLTSWGPDFGDNGRFRIPLDEFWGLFAKQGEAIAAVEIGKIDPAVKSEGCLSALKKIWGK